MSTVSDHAHTKPLETMQIKPSETLQIKQFEFETLLIVLSGTVQFVATSFIYILQSSHFVPKFE